MTNATTPAIVYRFGEGVYINLTNRCPNLCTFCIKTKWHMDFYGHNLDLSAGEPAASAVIEALEKELPRAPFKEVVFCGYGEPTMRLETLLFTAQILKGWRAQAKYPSFKIRLNTNGLGNLINHRNIVPALAAVIDSVNVSLNAQDEKTWRELVRPAAAYTDGYKSVVEFIRLCVKAGFEKVVASCVDQTAADPKAVKKVAQSVGADFYLRSFLDAQS